VLGNFKRYFVGRHPIFIKAEGISKDAMPIAIAHWVLCTMIRFGSLGFPPN